MHSKTLPAAAVAILILSGGHSEQALAQGANRECGGSAVSTATSPSDPVKQIRICGEVPDSAWVILYADFAVRWSDGETKKLSYSLESGSVSALKTDAFDFANGTRVLEHIQSIHLRVEPGNRSGVTVDWDCLGLDQVKVEYTTTKPPGVWKRIEINEPDPLVPSPGGSKTNCTGQVSVRIY